MSSKSISTFKEETLFNPINHNKNKPKFNKKRRKQRKKRLFVHPYLRRIRKCKRLIYKKMAFLKKQGRKVEKKPGLAFLDKNQRRYRPKIHIYRPYAQSSFHSQEARKAFYETSKITQKSRAHFKRKRSLYAITAPFTLFTRFKSALQTQLKSNESLFQKKKYYLLIL